MSMEGSRTRVSVSEYFLRATGDSGPRTRRSLYLFLSFMHREIGIQLCVIVSRSSDAVRMRENGTFARFAREQIVNMC